MSQIAAISGVLREVGVLRTSRELKPIRSRYWYPLNIVLRHVQKQIMSALVEYQWIPWCCAIMAFWCAFGIGTPLF